VRVLPESVARRLEVIPLSLSDDGRLKVAMADPLNLIALDELKMTISRDIEVSVAVPSEIRRELERAYSMQDSFEDALVEVVQGGGGLIEMDLVSVGADADDAPVIKIVNDVLEQAVREGASDVHIEPLEKLSGEISCRRPAF
jgi:type IV pilus assembly protein PilB